MNKIILLFAGLFFGISFISIAQSEVIEYGAKFEQTNTLSPGRLTTVMENKNELTGHSLSGYIYYVSADGQWALLRTSENTGDDVLINFIMPSLPENLLGKNVVANGTIKTLTANKQIVEKWQQAGLTKKTGNIVYQYDATGIQVR